jgi:hypothetical protein
VQYASETTLPAGDHLRVGQLTVDLQNINLTDSRTYSATVDTGRLVVRLPRNVSTELTGTVGDGMLTTARQLSGSSELSQQQRVQSGPNLSIRESIPAGTGGPVLTVNLHVGNGQLEVRR